MALKRRSSRLFAGARNCGRKINTIPEVSQCDDAGTEREASHGMRDTPTTATRATCEHGTGQNERGRARRSEREPRARVDSSYLHLDHTRGAIRGLRRNRGRNVGKCLNLEALGDPLLFGGLCRGGVFSLRMRSGRECIGNNNW